MRPTKNHVLLSIEVEKPKSGIVLPEGQKASGTLRILECGEDVGAEYKKGMRVWLANDVKVMEINHEGKQYLITKDSDIVALA